jgi:ribosome recycling factor
MEYSQILKELKQKMQKSLEQLNHDLMGLRTGRASAAFLDPVVIMAYGSKMNINEVATVSTPNAKTILVQVWNKDMVKTVEKAIADSNLGVSPVTDGQTIRINLPALSEERRKEIAKLAHKYTENARVSVRNVRRDGIDQLKKMEKDKEISEDELHIDMKKVQEVTDDFIKKVDISLKDKEQEIMHI